jgi:hypothetical protein
MAQGGMPQQGSRLSSAGSANGRRSTSAFRHLADIHKIISPGEILLMMGPRFLPPCLDKAMQEQAL